MDGNIAMIDGVITQREYWNGEVGARWARNQRRIDAVFAPLTAALFDEARLRVDSSLLDIGCGAGDCAIIAARRLGARGRVVAVDLSAPLLAVARERAEIEALAGASITFIEADAQSHDLGSSLFEHAISRFGVMFFEASGAAFANIRKALVPGGRLTFLCWRRIEDNPWIAVPRHVVLPLVPALEPALPDAPGPFRFAEAESIGAILAQAGFLDITVEAIDRPLTLARSGNGTSYEAAEAAADFAIELGPVSRLLRDQPASIRSMAQKRVADEFADRALSGAVTLAAGCWLVSAMR
ncbi:class I SAM-dependent methyltransferase [Methylobacterium marchantiae]|uniref:Class I SAM-dependent methyltransferase n=1 Tax=Methylobacterium marchantiae TaxID=600331 RepID=A0ABW3WYU6_9HYPH|nr:2-phytyl-1,4-beta-naphthoquinone methyltransferase, chloroplastic [Methylobacterium marchantiae]